MRVSDLSPGSVEPLLHGRLGRPYRFVEECASTQHLLDPDEAEGATAATDLQTHGRGRLGRTWETPPGRALLFSVLLHPRPPMALWPEPSLVAGDAVAAALPEQTAAAAHEPLAVSGRRGAARGNCAPPRSRRRGSGPCPSPA